MQIDFDSFRKRGVEAFNSLVIELNGRIQDCRYHVYRGKWFGWKHIK